MNHNSLKLKPAGGLEKTAIFIMKNLKRFLKVPQV
jgi:hypothetical protein